MMGKGLVISVSGKGGAGKTTVTALLLKWLIENTEEVILVVDADPATNLPDVLGAKIEKTVGMVSKQLKDQINMGKIPPTVAKKDLLEAWVHQTLSENDRFDLLAMGRSEGEGCYCYVNSVLTRILDNLTENYSITLLDMEAGLEHLSRRTDHDVDIMLIVTDPSKMGFETAKRIKELISEVHIKVGKVFLVGNKFNHQLSSSLNSASSMIGIEVAGYLPNDDEVSSYNMLGKPLLELPDTSPSYKAIEQIAQNIGLTRFKRGEKS
ncbi:AAA family ATPase [Candidatus Bathyarchaeota archaeon]|nr:AAA family ATPase [Candidatus Bathyarchaeota archaeon]